MKIELGTLGVDFSVAKRKNRQATHIAPLQPPILAVFLPWGVLAGAGRMRPAGCKCRG